jgi:WD40 repeat protein
VVTRITTANATRLKQLSSRSMGDGAVRSVAWAPDGLYVATGGDDGTLRLWGAFRREIEYDPPFVLPRLTPSR